MNSQIKNQLKKLYRPTWAKVDLDAIKHNFHALKRFSDKRTKILCVVKADAYGHGMLKVAKLLNREGADFFGVADINEGICLREHGIKKPVLLFESQLPSLAKEIIRYDLTAMVSNLDLATALNREAKRLKKRIPIHIKVDTGMGRLGVWYEDALAFIRSIRRLRNISLEGICTHFAASDTDEHFTRSQIDFFLRLVKQLKLHSISIPYVHAANSMGLVNYCVEDFNLVRPGLILYGLYPSQKLTTKITLKPALSVKSKIVFLKKITKDRSISYGRTFMAKKGMVIATVPIGYNDGYFRCLSNKSFVLVNGMRCPVVGCVTMDQLMVDVSKIKAPKIGMEVILLGRQGKQAISADELAHKANTINYEITCSLGNRLPRIYPVKK